MNRSRPPCCLLLCLIALLLGSGIAFAQPASPREFYPQDFASAPGGGGAASPGAPQRAPKRRPTPLRAVEQPAGQPAGVPQAQVQRRGPRVIAYVYVNSADPAHLRSVIESVVRLSDSKLGLVSTVYHVGDYRNISPEIAGALARRGIILFAATSVYQPEPITASPAWFVSTPKGYHIIEGVVRLEELFNPFGEFEPPTPQTPESPQNAGSAGALSSF